MSGNNTERAHIPPAGANPGANVPDRLSYANQELDLFLKEDLMGGGNFAANSGSSADHLF
jgi:hypothetical protein